MGKPLLTAGIVLTAMIVLAACSEAPKTTVPETKAKAETEPPAPAGPVSAKTAFFEMFKPARAWATDFLLLSMSSNEVPGMQSEGGKFAMWTAVLVSPSRREARTFTYSVVDRGPDIPKGVDAGAPQVWSGATPQSRPFQASYFTVDSDAAYRTALEKAGTWARQHPDRKAVFSLGNASRFPAPVWYLLWGNKTSGYAVYVNALTGTVVKGT